jgi:hypothetical protein
VVTHDEDAPALPEPPRWDSEYEVTGVLIGTPCYGGQVTSRYLISAIATAELLTAEGFRHGWATTEGESLVQRARNGIVAKFLANPEASHLVFIDADIEWQPQDVIRLLAHDVDVVCGVYPKKKFPIEYAFHPPLDNGGRTIRDIRTGRIQIDCAATGFLCIKRAVFEKMAAAYPQTKYRISTQEATDDDNKWMYNFFDVFVEDGILWSEDYGFSRRWRAIGGEIWMDPQIKLNHVGQHVYEGDPTRIFRELPMAPVSAAA